MKRRLFVAADIPKSLAVGFSAYQKTLSINQVSWTREEDFHLTVAFLGYVTEENIPSVEKEISLIAGITKQFELHYDRVILAPPGKDASMIWAKLAPSEQYSDLVGKIYSNVKPYITEQTRTERIPHITLARIKQGIVLEESSLAQPELEQKKFVVDQISLFESKPIEGASEYTRLSTFKLEGN